MEWTLSLWCKQNLFPYVALEFRIILDVWLGVFNLFAVEIKIADLIKIS